MGPLQVSRLSISPGLSYSQVLKALSWRQFARNAHIAPHLQVQSSVEAKYRKKLEAKAKAQGVETIDELREAYKHKIAQLRKDTDGVLDPLNQTMEKTYVQNTLNQSTNTSANFHSKGPKSTQIPLLSSFINVEKISLHESPEIELIWRARHAKNPQKLCAVIPKETYLRMASQAKLHPMFILPLPRNTTDSEMHVLQWSFPDPLTSTCIFTSLGEYKQRGEYARPHTLLTHHLDLIDTNNVVFMHGDVEKNTGVDVADAKWLVMALQKFYGAAPKASNENRTLLLSQFSKGNKDFDIQALIDEARKLD